MKYKSLMKDTRREIWRTKSRFFSIFAIILLGVSFFAGLKSTCPDMKLTAEEYYEDSHLMDYRLVSTYGFDEDDIAALREVDGVEGVMPGYSSDLIYLSGENEYVVKAYSYDYTAAGESNENYLNRPVLKEGRFPEKPGECVVEAGASAPDTFRVGNTITFSSGTDDPLSDTLDRESFEIVGIVESSMYISYERGNSTIGNGTVSAYVLLPASDFTSEVYTEVYVTMEEARSVSPFDSEYNDIIDRLSDPLKQAASNTVNSRYDEIVQEAEQELEDARQQLADGEKQQQEELASALEQIEQGERDYQNGLDEYNTGKTEFEQTIADARQQIDDAGAQIDAQQNQYQQALSLYQSVEQLAKTAQTGTPFTAEQQAVVDASASLNENFPTLLTAALVMGDPAAQQMLTAAMQQTSRTLDESASKLSAGRDELIAQSQQLTQKEEEGKAQFEAAYQELEDAKAQLEQARIDYETGKQESDAELEDARQKIADGEAELADLKAPEIYLFTRDDNVGYSNFSGDADKVDAVARIFPVFFIFVAALVCLTTMTRMIEEQRTSIGTLKALGYSKSAIAFKYLCYAFIASFSGSVLGLLIGFQLFPRVIFYAYSTLYHFPGFSAPFRWDYAAWCTVAAVACTGIATLCACYAELHSRPAQLMRPRPPKNGKRVFLERIGWFWSRLGFIHKVSVRNFFRYKKRVIMTVTGIAGCTALMLTGFGLTDSISTIVDKQFDSIFVYDVTVAYDGEIAQPERDSLHQLVESQPQVKEQVDVQQLNMSAVNEGSDVDCYLVIPEQPDEFETFVHLGARGSDETETLDDSGVIITEKLSRLLGLSVGDTLTLEDSDGKTVEAPVSGITENYLFHYVYMTPTLYQELYGEPFEPNVIYLNFNDDVDEQGQNAFSQAVLTDDNVLQVNRSDSMGNTFNDMIQSLNAVVVVIILAAGALALVVLYNLTNINVNERVRELATLKVLGFYDREVSAYIYRENVASSILGILIGLVLGIFLHQFVIVTAEVDLVMFIRQILPLSYVWAALLTFGFTLLVNFFLHFKLKKIDMVESLKSVE